MRVPRIVGSANRSGRLVPGLVGQRECSVAESGGLRFWRNHPGDAHPTAESVSGRLRPGLRR
jgi:hypothetical protein